MAYEIGSRVGDYEVLQVLGAGGMGRVYKVRNLLSDRIEAMKVLLPDLTGNPDLADRFMREIKVQASLDHPNVAKLYTALRVENQLLMLMEYLEGVTLDKMMEAGPVPIEKAVGYIAQVLSALSYAHSRGIVHRDLKPANIMVLSNGAVKLMDFGIAKMAADRKLTQTGSTVGSLYYMSPEQIRGAGDLDPRSDLYSLGVTLYEVVTGARPFQGDSEYSIMAAHLQKNPPPPIEISPGIPRGLNEVILQALEKEPAKRFQSADAFRNALLHASRQPQAAEQPSAPAPVRQAAAPAPATHSRRALWITVGAVLVLVVIAVVAMQLPRFRKTTAETAATPPPEVRQTQAPATVAPEAELPAAPAAPSQGTIVPPAPQVKPAVGDTRPERPIKTGAAPVRPFTQVQEVNPSRVPGLTAQVPSIQPSAPGEEDPRVAEQLKEVREQLTLLGIRMDTVRGSLDTLRRQQAASGLGLRADMANAAQRMEYYYSRVEQALKNKDAEAAKKNLDLAEREVSKLEGFLGR